MRTLIVYYSRSGNTKTLAAILAKALGADLAELRCALYRPGPLRYLRAGYDSVRGNLPPIEVPQMAFHDYDLALIGGPIWTSHPALPIRAFLAQRPRLPARVALFLTYGGHSLPDPAIDEMAAQLPGPVTASLSLSSKEIGDGSLSGAVAGFLDRVTPARSTAPA